MDVRKLFWVVGIALLPVFVWLSSDFGATWDEPQQRAKALHLIDYWSGRVPLEVPMDGAHLYGAPLDVVAALLERPGGADPYVIRHRVIAVAGWLGILLTGLLATRLFSPAHGLLAMFLLAVNPRYVADAMNNPKDLPFATAATALLLVMTRVSAEPPFLGWRTASIFALVLGLAINVRPGALLFFAYLCAFVGFRLLSRRMVSVRALLTVGARLGAILAGGIALGWISWPWAYADPITAPFRGLRELSHFPYGGRVLFAGEEFSALTVPPSYVPTWFWLALPPVVLAGSVLSMATLGDSRRRDAVLALWGTVLFPIVYVIGTRATLYDGVRHLLFVLPPLTILAAVGWRAAWEGAGRWRWLVGAAAVVGLVEPLAFQWRNHPHQAAYIQPLAGGPRAAFARYDLDYWGNCLLESMRRVDELGGNSPVAATGWPMIVLDANKGRVAGVRLLEEGDGSPTYTIRLARGSREALLRLDARPDLTRIETADGALLCVVFPTDSDP